MYLNWQVCWVQFSLQIDPSHLCISGLCFRVKDPDSAEAPMMFSKSGDGGDVQIWQRVVLWSNVAIICCFHFTETVRTPG